MNIITRLLGGGKLGHTSANTATRHATGLGLADPNHIARAQIDEAAHMADRLVQVFMFDEQPGLMTNSGDSMELAAAIDRAIEKAPADLDLLVAKSGALCCGLAFKTAEDVLDKALALAPNHFEAAMRKQYWAKWEHLFHYPPWTTTAQVLHPVMADRCERQRSVQLVRDGLQMGVAIVRRVQKQDFAGRMPNTPRSKWEPVWSETPYGGIVAHYLLVDDNPAAPFRSESFIKMDNAEEVNPEAGFWLLRRLANLGSCFLVLADGDTVLYNQRFALPRITKTTLETILSSAPRGAARDSSMYKRACQWHMQNFDIERIRF